MAYNIKTTHTEVIGNVPTEVKTDATVYEEKEVKAIGKKLEISLK